MKVLFLDIDGVLNNDFTKDKIGEGIFEDATGIDPKLAKIYLEWKAQRDFEVVLSSTWRQHPSLYSYLNKKGIFWIDTTPVCRSWKAHRGTEIEEWLKGNKPDKYAVLDDTSFPCKNLVQTSAKHGLRKKQLDIVDKILCMS